MNKISDIGEFNLIKRITHKPKHKNIVIGIGDDAAVIKTSGLKALTTDTLVEGDHFNKDWFTPRQIGMKSIEINVSDVAAMGGIPEYGLISLAIPKELEVNFIEEIYQGIWETCNKYKMEIIGGNMTCCKTIVISVTLIGNVNSKSLSLRKGAKPGDYLFVSGPVGNGRAGLRIFQERITGFKDIKRSYQEPKSKLDFSKKISAYVSSMIDISDGLASEIRHICNNSKCGAIIYKNKIPIKKDVKRIAAILDENYYDYALYGGEDFELLYTIPKNKSNKVPGYLIGEITKEKNIILKNKENDEIINKSGYDHFLKT